MSELKFYTVEWQDRFIMAVRVEDEDEAVEFALDSENLHHDELYDILEGIIQSHNHLLTGEEDIWDLVEICKEKEDLWREVKSLVEVKQIPYSHKVLLEVRYVDY